MYNLKSKQVGTEATKDFKQQLKFIPGRNTQSESNVLFDISKTWLLILEKRRERHTSFTSVEQNSGAGEQLLAPGNEHHREPAMDIKHWHPGKINKAHKTTIFLKEI